MPTEDQRDIREVLAHISEGQSLDVQRFEDPASLTAAELDRYTYLVAGSVGEFWTRVCIRYLPRFSTLSPEQMLSLGVAYGKGLQLVNILRDVGEDLRAGRCYLPAVLGEAAARPSGSDRDDAAVARSRRAGDAGRCRIRMRRRNRRVRLATVLPALIGLRTIALLRVAGAAAFTQKIKVPRAEVRELLWKTAGSLASPRVIRKLAGNSAAASR
jgi:farnesyl-diphosphate farnesyltransferase